MTFQNPSWPWIRRPQLKLSEASMTPAKADRDVHVRG